MKERVSKLRDQLLESRSTEKRLIIQYERIVKEWQKNYNLLIENGWRLLFMKFSIWFEEKIARKVR